jgi:antitoxin component YwqK of YwqJK toxin-antitoxin module
MNKIIVFTLFTFFTSSLLLSQNVGKMVDDTIVNYIDINNNKQGKWIKYYDNGQIKYKGFFIDNKPTGTFTYYHPNGKIKSVLNYDEAGYASAELFWSNGNKAAKGVYDENRERHKTWMLYYEDGIMSAIINYNHGKANGRVQMFYPITGKMVLDCVYKDGKLDGPYKKFFEKGGLIEEGTYAGSTRHGYWKFYGITGSVDEEGMYVNGERDGDWIIYTDNPKGDTINYKDGIPDNYDELMEEWKNKQQWAKENQNQFKQPEDYLDNPIDFFRPSQNPNTQLK